MAFINANYVKFLRGTPTAYANLLEKDPDTLYFITDSDSDMGQLFLGETLISSFNQSSNITTGTATSYLSQLKDVFLRGPLSNKQLLGYNVALQKWAPISLDDLDLEKKIFSENQAGLVPAPKSSDKNKFLRGDGTWQAIGTNNEESLFNTISSDFSIQNNNGRKILEIDSIPIRKVQNLEEVLEQMSNSIQKQPISTEYLTKEMLDPTIGQINILEASQKMLHKQVENTQNDVQILQEQLKWKQY